MAIAAAVTGLSAGLAYRWDIVELRDAFALLRWAAYGGAGACLVCAAGLIRAHPGGSRRGFVLALAGLATGALVFWVPFSQQRVAQRVPAIHDITTDTRNPPEFKAVVGLRPQGANSLEYGGAAIAEQQREAYPHIRPADFTATSEAVFDAAEDVARDLGWDIVDSYRDEGRIEAVDTTFWFGFKDDVVVRVVDTGEGTRVDVRSVSRVGVSDIGTNAARITRFMEALEAEIGAAS